MLFTFAIADMKIANAVFLLYAGSVIASLLLGTPLFGESLSWTKSLALCLSLLGLALHTSAFVAVTVAAAAALLSGLLDGATNALRKSWPAPGRHW